MPPRPIASLFPYTTLFRSYQKALKSRLSPPCGKARGMFVHHTNVAQASSDSRRLVCYDCGVACDLGKMRTDRIGLLRSEEHTSELQSRPHLVCRLLLEKKN